MKRLLIGSAVVAGVIAAGIPAAAGLSGNASFSHKLPVRVPSQAQVVKFDDHGHATDDSTASHSPRATATPRRAASPGATSTIEPGDDKGGLRISKTPEPGDDNGSLRTTRTPEPGDDNGGGLRTTKTAEPGDDNGGTAKAVTTAASTAQSSDDESHGGSDDSGHDSETHGGGH
jgi:hypothetical protein